MSNTMTEVFSDIEGRVHRAYERYGKRVFKGEKTVQECNEVLIYRLEQNYSNLKEFRRTIHNMYMYGMITNFDEFKECIDRTDELLKKLDTDLDNH